MEPRNQECKPTGWGTHNKLEHDAHDKTEHMVLIVAPPDAVVGCFAHQRTAGAENLARGVSQEHTKPVFPDALPGLLMTLVM